MMEELQMLHYLRALIATRMARTRSEESGLGVVEYVVDDVRELLEASDGVTVKPKNLTLNLADASTEQMDMPWTLEVPWAARAAIR